VPLYSKVEYINNQKNKVLMELALGTCHGSVAVYTCDPKMAWICVGHKNQSVEERA
jgi:hypothetical protein